MRRPERFDLQSILPGTQTLLIFLYPYRFAVTEQKLRAAPFKVARYAWQKDYHLTLKEKIQSLLNALGLEGRAVTDSAPLFERYWARRSGLGFIGRNGMLIDKAAGSYFLIATAFVKDKITADLPLGARETSPQADFTELCKDCRLCIDACPTGALFGDGLMDTVKCISYRTIESRVESHALPGEKKHRWVFGCDICQQVCPYNKSGSIFAKEEFNEEHPAAMRIASGELLTGRRDLKDSVFYRRGSGKINDNIKAVS